MKTFVVTTKVLVSAETPEAAKEIGEFFLFKNWRRDTDKEDGELLSIHVEERFNE